MSAEQRPLLPTWASSTLVAIAFTSLVVVTWSLAQQNRLLKRGVEPEPLASLDSGDQLGTIGLRSLDGEDTELITAIDGGGVMVIFTTTCPFCEATLPFWDMLKQQVSESGWPFVAVSLHDAERTQVYLSQHNLEWSAWTPATPGDREALNAKIVPTTAVVDAHGKVISLWRGALQEEEVREIRDAMAALRGVTQPQSISSVPSGGGGDPSQE